MCACGHECLRLAVAAVAAVAMAAAAAVVVAAAAVVRVGATIHDE